MSNAAAMDDSIAFIDDNSAINCAICLDSIAAENRCVAIDCMHQFCDDCLQQWLNRTSACPLCNKNIKSVMYNIKSDIDYEQRFVFDANGSDDDAAGDDATDTLTGTMHDDEIVISDDSASSDSSTSIDD